MKLLLSLSALCLLLILSQSCTKDNPDTPITDTLVISHTDTLYINHPTSIFGLWVGTYDITQGPDAGTNDLYYSFELHKDSSMQVTSLGANGQTLYGIGTWSLNGTAFSAHITTTNLSQTGTAQTIAATYDSTNNMLTGIVSTDLYDFKANFELEKVQ